MKRVFFLTGRLPFPPAIGPDFRNWMNLAAAARNHVVGAFGIVRRDRPRPMLDNLEVWHSASDGAALDDVSAGAVDESWIGDPGWRPSDPYFSSAIEAELDQRLAAFRPDVVVVEGLSFSAYLPVARRHAPEVVLDCHNVETELQHQLSEAEASPVKRVVRRQFAARTEMLERESVAAVDEVWVCSPIDQRLMAERLDVASHIVPNAVPIERYRGMRAKRRKDVPDSPSLVFPAHFGYLPNENGAIFFLERALPEIHARRPGVTVTLAGRSPGRRIAAAATDSRVVVTGAVEDMKAYLAAADAAVVPLFEGSGTRLKVLEAFASGLPVISTGKGVEGLSVEAGVHFLEAGTPAEFADAVDELHQPGVAERVSAAAYDYVVAFHSLPAVADAMGATLLPGAVTS